VLGQRGKTWLRACFWLLIMVTAFWPAAGIAAGTASFASTHWPAPVVLVAAQTPMEAQMMEKRPVQTSPLSPQSYLEEICGLEGGNLESTLKLPKNFRISFRYNGENPVNAAERFSQPPLLFKYSMDYCLSSKLKVGLSGFLYQPPADHLSFLRQKTDMLMGWGPSLRYDLGRWGFTFQSQVSQTDKFRTDDSKDLQSWFRVWYAF